MRWCFSAVGTAPHAPSRAPAQMVVPHTALIAVPLPTPAVVPLPGQRSYRFLRRRWCPFQCQRQGCFLRRLLRHFQCQWRRRFRADCRVTASVGGRAASCDRLRCPRTAVESDGHAAAAARVVADLFSTQAPPTTDQGRRAHVGLRRSPSLWEASHDGQCISTMGDLPTLL